MKTRILLLAIAFIVTSSLCNPSLAQVNVSDSLALVDLYNSTNGANWNKHTNWLTTSPVSTWFGVLTDEFNRVNDLELSGNNLVGTLPPSICHLTELLYFLNLNNNKISGSIPDSIGNLILLRNLNLSYNPLTGHLPSLLGFSNMLTLRISNTNIDGTIPASINNNPSSLNEIDLSHNRLTGTVPNLDKLTNLATLLLYNNQLTGTLSFLKSNYKSLYNVDVSYNRFSQPTNVLSGPNLPHLSIKINSNSFTFNGLEYISTHTASALYSNQRMIPLHNTNGVLSASAGGTLANNTYTWYKVGGSSVSTTGDSTYTPAQSGRYYVTITNAVATKLILQTDTVNVSVPLAVNGLKVSLYPNPAVNTLHINGLAKESNAKVTIADLEGNVWVSTTLKNSGTVTCDVSNLKRGNYIVTVHNGREVKTAQFVKQ